MLAWIKRKWVGWKAKRLRALVLAEMASNWTVIAQETERTHWGDPTKSVISAKYLLEQNDLGHRRVNIVWRRSKHYELGSERYAESVAWAAQRGKSKPIKELA